MLNKLKSKSELFPFFTTDLLENDYGVLIDKTMPENSYLAIDIDSYYHKHGNIPSFHGNKIERVGKMFYERDSV